MGSSQEVTVSNFFGKTNMESPFQHQGGIEETKKKRIS